MAKFNERAWCDAVAKSDARARAWGCAVLLLIVGAMAFGLLMPDPLRSGPPSKRMRSQLNLTQIALPMHTYHDSSGVFPARAITSPDGKPLLSWCVTLLPYLEGADLYPQFHLDEPWDSPHNFALIDKMPKPLKNPNSPSKNETNYLAVVGPGTFFAGSEALELKDIADGPDHTILVVEADHAVPWTKPEELDYNPQTPRRNLENLRPGGFLALMADGACRLIPKDQDDDTIRALMTISGGEATPAPQ